MKVYIVKEIVETIDNNENTPVATICSISFSQKRTDKMTRKIIHKWTKKRGFFWFFGYLKNQNEGKIVKIIIEECEYKLGGR